MTIILFYFSDSSSEDDTDIHIAEESQHLPLEEAFGDEVSGDAVPAPAPLPQRMPAPVVESDGDHMSAVEELVEALARPFTVSAIFVCFDGLKSEGKSVVKGFAD